MSLGLGAIVGGTAALLLGGLILAHRRSGVPIEIFSEHTGPTKRLPFESMSEVVHERRR